MADFNKNTSVIPVSFFDKFGWWVGNGKQTVAKGTGLSPDACENVYTPSGDGLIAKYNADTGEWSSETTDHRGLIYFDETGKEYSISAENEGLPLWALLQKPTEPVEEEPTEEIPLSTQVEKALEAVQTEKSRVKNGGFLVGGYWFDSDAPAQIMITQLMFEFMSDPTYQEDEYKSSEGQWVVLDEALFAQVVDGWKAHCKACFAWQKAKEVEINECTTAEQLEAVSLIYGE